MKKRYTKKRNRYSRNRYSRKRVRYTKKNTSRKYHRGGMQSVTKTLKKAYKSIRKPFKKTLQDEIQNNIDTLLSFEKPDKDKKTQIAKYILTKKRDERIIYYYPFVIEIYIYLTNISKLKEVEKKFYRTYLGKLLKKYVGSQNIELVMIKLDKFSLQIKQ